MVPLRIRTLNHELYYRRTRDPLGPPTLDLLVCSSRAPFFFSRSIPPFFFIIIVLFFLMEWNWKTSVCRIFIPPYSPFWRLPFFYTPKKKGIKLHVLLPYSFLSPETFPAHKVFQVP